MSNVHYKLRSEKERKIYIMQKGSKNEKEKVAKRHVVRELYFKFLFFDGVDSYWVGWIQEDVDLIAVISYCLYPFLN